MEAKSDNFISELFWTTDERFIFQKVGRFYNLYDCDNEYNFVRDFSSFKKMQEYMNKARENNAEKEKR